MGKFSETLAILLVAALVILLVAIIIGFPVMWLWNWLMPTLFGLTKITFWQAWGLSVLCGFLFKSTNVNSKS